MNECEKAKSINKLINESDINAEFLHNWQIDFIRELCEKQIPKKAEYRHKANGKCALIICPNCENRLTVARYIFPLDRYCKECGQHYVVDIKDWSVEE